MEQESPETRPKPKTVSRASRYKPSQEIVSSFLNLPDTKIGSSYPARSESSSRFRMDEIARDIDDEFKEYRHYKSREIPPEEDTQLTTDMFELD